MRRDMAKVIIERPRRGSSLPSQKKGYRKALERTPAEELPRREPMLGRWRGMQRTLNENLSPLVRFLRSSIGRPWNKIHQELCEHVSFENAVQKHVLAHISQYVVMHVECRNGRLFGKMSWGRARALMVGEMYVCPETGLLRVVEPNRRHRLPERMSLVFGGPGSICLCRNGEWYAVRLQLLPIDGSPRWDVWLNRFLTFNDFRITNRLYGEPSFAVSVTGMPQAAVRKLLRNFQNLHSGRRKRRTIPVKSCHCS